MASNFTKKKLGYGQSKEEKNPRSSQGKGGFVVEKRVANRNSDHPSPLLHPPTGPPDPHSQFTIGSMVCIDIQKGDPLYGVIKWIGTIPDFNGAIAGLEMVISLDSVIIMILIL